MKIQLFDTTESMHQWIDDDGVTKSVTAKFELGQILDTAAPTVRDVMNKAVKVGDFERWLKRLVNVKAARELSEGDAPSSEAELRARAAVIEADNAANKEPEEQ